MLLQKHRTNLGVMGAIFLHESYRSADLFLCDCTLNVVVLQPISGDKIEEKKKKDFFFSSPQQFMVRNFVLQVSWGYCRDYRPQRHLNPSCSGCVCHCVSGLMAVV